MSQLGPNVVTTAWRLKGYFEGRRNQPMVDIISLGKDATLSEFMKDAVEAIGCRTITYFYTDDDTRHKANNPIKEKPVITFIYAQDGKIKQKIVNSRTKLIDLPNSVSFNPHTQFGARPVNLFHLNRPVWGAALPAFNPNGFFNAVTPSPPPREVKVRYLSEESEEEKKEDKSEAD